MADCVLFLIFVLAKAAVSHIKQRIVAKSVITGQFVSNAPLTGSLGSQLRLIRKNAADGANIAPVRCFSGTSASSRKSF